MIIFIVNRLEIKELPEREIGEKKVAIYRLILICGIMLRSVIPINVYPLCYDESFHPSLFLFFD